MIVVLAAIADTLCLTGYFFYGAALAAAATTALSLGQPFWLVFCFCWIGSTAGDIVNILIARYASVSGRLKARMNRVADHGFLSMILFRNDDPVLVRFIKYYFSAL